jgi:hypothetical protein
MQRFNLELEECPNVKLNGRCEQKLGRFYKGIKEYFTSTKVYTVDGHAKFALEWEPLIGVNTLA